MVKESYEALSYTNKVYTPTHPDHLSYVAHLFGLESPDIEKARVLELGCGNGMNLIAQANNLPGAEFIGLDLAGNQIQYAKATAHDLGLSNIDFRQYDLMELSAQAFGKFDYIIAHGLISWVPLPVRDKIFSLYRELLVENGVGHISYNTYPGWHYRQIVRGIGLIHTREEQDPLKKVEDALSFLSFLGEHTPLNDVYKFIIQNELNDLSQRDKESLFHDNFAEINNPIYFHEFTSMLAEKGLQFLSEAELFAMSTQNLSPEPKAFIESIPDILWREQYLDFFKGRIFRQSLVCHQHIALNHTPRPASLDALYLASALKSVSNKPQPHTDKKEKYSEDFSGSQGSTIEINHPLTKAALQCLGNRWGDSMPVSELLAASKTLLEQQGYATTSWEEEFENAKDIILQIIQRTTLIEGHTYRPKIQTKIGDKPKLSSMAKWQITNDNHISAAYCRVVKIDNPLVKKLLLLLDGTRTRHQLHTELSDFVRSSQEIDDKTLFLKDLKDNLDKHLERFAKLGLFVS